MSNCLSNIASRIPRYSNPKKTAGRLFITNKPAMPNIAFREDHVKIDIIIKKAEIGAAQCL